MWVHDKAVALTNEGETLCRGGGGEGNRTTRSY